MEIGKSESCAGLSYVGFSRVKKLDDLAIPTVFARNRLDRIHSQIQDRIGYMTEKNLL